MTKPFDNTVPVHWGSSLIRVLIPGLAGAAAILFFHPGAMDMDRIKWSLLLAALFPLLAVALRGSLLLSSRLPLSPPLMLAMMIPAFMIFSCLRTSLPTWEEFRPAAGLIVLTVTAAAVRDGAWARPWTIPAVLLAAGAAAALYGVLQTTGFEPFYLENPEGKAVSTLGNTNAAAEVFALLIPLAAAGLLGAARFLTFLSILSLPLLAAGLYATGGRGGLIAALAGLCVLAFIVIRRPGALQGKRIALAVILLAGGASAAAFLRTDQAKPFKNIDTDESIFSAEYPTNKIRILIWQSTLDMIGDHPVLGAGPGRFRTAFPRYRDPEEARIRGRMGAVTEVENPHNEILWAAAEGGIGAAAALALFLLLMLRQSFAAAGDARGRTDGGSREHRFFLAAGIAGLVTSFGLLCLVRSPLHNPATAVILFLACGMIDAARYDSAPAKPAGFSTRVIAAAGVLMALLFLWFGGRAFRSDLVFAGVGLASAIEQAEYDRLERAVEIDDDNIDLVNFLGQIDAKLAGTEADAGGSFTDNARDRLGLVLKRHPNHPGALRSMARLALLSGDAAAGRRLLKRSLRLTGSNRIVELAAADIIEKAGRPRDAVPFLKEGYKTEPNLLLRRADSMLDAGRFREAAVYAEAYLEQFPLNAESLHVLARSLRELGEGGEDEAFRLMQLAISLDWLEAGEWEKACGSAERSLRYGEGEGAARLVLAMARAARGEPFEPPPGVIGGKIFLERFKRFANDKRLPPAVCSYLKDLP